MSYSDTTSFPQDYRTRSMVVGAPLFVILIFALSFLAFQSDTASQQVELAKTPQSPIASHLTASPVLATDSTSPSSSPATAPTPDQTDSSQTPTQASSSVSAAPAPQATSLATTGLDSVTVPRQIPLPPPLQVTTGAPKPIDLSQPTLSKLFHALAH
ncbi:MAG: hypothetical protein WA843_00885 [Candidatus Saccharimonadales bacterium]